jgi:DNA mismatch repair protein MutS2
MNSYKQLEFDKIRKLLAGYCDSPISKEKSLNLTPKEEISEINYRLEITSECQLIHRRGYRYSFEKLVDNAPILYELGHQTYSFQEFSAIIAVVKISLAISSDVTSNEKDFKDTPNYCDLVRELSLFPELAKRFNEIFSYEGEVLDTASPALSSIRSQQISLRKSILNSLQNKLQDSKLGNVIQDKIITQRDGRYVIPLKDGTIGSLPGIIHGYSGSKATIFVEPNEVVGQNNNLRRLKQEEEEEIYRIFCEFTSQILANRDDISSNNKVLAELDFYFGVGKLAQYFNANKPKIVEETFLSLKSARHPLLIHSYGTPQKVIPFDLTLGRSQNHETDNTKILILSGPNTGGKTITLKATGLLSLMALSGLPIPADEESEIGMFSGIFADIGDEQSLENSLSTFSSHLDRIKMMLNLGDDKSLVLIDEIGAATDPEQGAALAQAIMEELIDLQVIGIITTHFTTLKLFAEQTTSCLNAAMQFDPEKHLPTYHFKAGLPGNSFALEIAEKLGLNKRTMNRAKELTGKQNVELTELITKMSQEKKELARAKFEYELKIRLLEMKISEYEKAMTSLENEKKDIRRQSIKEAREYLGNLQRELNKEISDMREVEKKERKKATETLIKKAAVKNIALAKQESEMTVQELKPLTNPQVGDVVWIKEFEGTGEIIAVEKNLIKVDINDFFFTTDIDRAFKTERKLVPKTQRKTQTSPKTVKTELKLLGLTFDEALPVLQKFIDEGYAVGLPFLRIVHGKGTGALRSKIRNYLKGVERVKDFHSPPPEAGGDGVTVVTF